MLQLVGNLSALARGACVEARHIFSHTTLEFSLKELIPFAFKSAILSYCLLSNFATAQNFPDVVADLEITPDEITFAGVATVSYTHLTLPTIYSV